MKNSEVLTALIKEISGQSRILSIPSLYIDLTGGLEAALFLSQAIYWSDKGRGERGWFYKTYDQWHSEIKLTEYQVRKSVKLLSEWGVISTKLKKAVNGSPTVHYKVHMPILETIVRAHFYRIYETGHRVEGVVGSHGLTGNQVGDTHTLAAVQNRGGGISACWLEQLDAMHTLAAIENRGGRVDANQA